ncbi:hypothetical protein VPH35_027596 [Triticum aestivum]
MYTCILLELMLERIKSSIIFVSQAVEKLTPHSRLPSSTYLLCPSRVHRFTHVICFLLFEGRFVRKPISSAASPAERELDIMVLASLLMDTSFWPFFSFSN